MVAREQLSEVMTFALRTQWREDCPRQGESVCKGPEASSVHLCDWSLVGEETELERWAGPDHTRLQGCREETGFYSECDGEALGAVEQ